MGCIALAVAVGAGCGSQTTVVTVTEAAPVEAAATSLATESDSRVAALVREQAAEMDSLSEDISGGALRRDTADTYTRAMNLQQAGSDISLVGLSPCMQEVAQQWGVTSQKFFDLFSILQGAIPSMAAEAAQRFENGPPLKNATDSLLSQLDTCLTSLGSAQASSGGDCIAYAGDDQPELASREGCESAGSGKCDVDTQLRAWAITCDDARRLIEKIDAGATEPAELDGFTCTGGTATGGECRSGSRYFTF